MGDVSFGGWQQSRKGGAVLQGEFSTSGATRVRPARRRRCCATSSTEDTVQWQDVLRGLTAAVLLSLMAMARTGPNSRLERVSGTGDR